MNKKDIEAFDKMIKNAWNDNNAFCRKLKEYIGEYFDYVPELKERCHNPYWTLTKEMENTQNGN